METLLLGFGVFFVVTTTQRYVALKRWVLAPFALLLGAGGTYAAHLPWWTAVSIAGISTLINGIEALLFATTDRAILDLPRPGKPTSRR